jgi:hypothetical protein
MLILHFIVLELLVRNGYINHLIHVYVMADKNNAEEGVGDRVY